MNVKSAYMLKIILILNLNFIFGSANILRWLAENILNVDYSNYSEKVDEEIQSEARLQTNELIKLYGYPVEIHTVKTKDDYILTMHRIPYGKSFNSIKNRVPVLLSHCAACSSQIFVNNREDSLGFILADEGYDVWLANYRPNVYASHKKYSRKHAKFWQYTFDELGLIDLPAMIDYVIENTNFSKIISIGYSQGTIANFELLSAIPDYNDKLMGFAALAPITSSLYIPSFLRYFLMFKKEVMIIHKLFLGPRFVYLYPFVLNLTTIFCPPSDPIICETLIGLVAGYGRLFYNKTRCPIYINHVKYGMSILCLPNMAQGNSSGIFKRFDYGMLKNIEKYKQLDPPEYVLEKISTPVALFHAANDPLSTPFSVAFIKRRLPSLFMTELIDHPLATHVNLVELHPAREMLYNRVLDALTRMKQLSNVNF